MNDESIRELIGILLTQNQMLKDFISGDYRETTKDFEKRLRMVERTIVGMMAVIAFLQVFLKKL